ncbi:MAG: diaminopimelate decarboxylase [Granulosicoccaceae bacterium]
MTAFTQQNGELYAEDLPLTQLATQYGTPLYVYSRAAIETAWRAFDQSLVGWNHQVCYAVKANSNLAVLGVLAELGSGFDIVSIGELERVLAAGGDASKIVFSGVGKKASEMARALEVGIHSFNVESAAELERLNAVASELNQVARVSLRINPDVDAQTHPYISTGLKENKFGIGHDVARSVYQRAAKLSHIDVVGMDCHIGSQLTEIDPYIDAAKRLLGLIDELAEDGIVIRELDLGGGQGIRYKDETPMDLDQWHKTLAPLIEGRDLKIIVEPGRAIVGNAGVMLTEVQYLKENGDRHFAIVDGAMNDLLRPALYSAWQEITAVKPRDQPAIEMDVVGPVCESADFLGKQRPLAVQAGDLLAVHSAGAYCAVMSSNYNSRPLTAEVMVDGDKHQLVRRRQSEQELFALESTFGG